MSSGDVRIGDGDCGGNAAPYVLGALMPAEREAFVIHLRSCSVCREEVSALETVAASLPAAVPQISAPPELKDRVMAEVREEVRRESALEGNGQTAGDRRRRWRPVLAPVAVGLAVILLVAVLVARGGGGGASTRVIRAQVTAPGGSASVHVTGAHAELTLAGIPQTRPGRVYELWIKRSGAPLPTDALFTVSSRGDATVGVPGKVSGIKVLMVTSEPLGGSRAPTSQPVVVAQLG